MQYVHQDTIQLFDTSSGSSPIDLTSQISQFNSVYKGNRFEIRQFDSISIEVIDLELHIVIKMNWHTNHIGFQVQLPPFICNNSLYEVSGHLGNCDGVSDNKDPADHPQGRLNLVRMMTFCKMHTGLIDAATEGLFMLTSSRNIKLLVGVMLSNEKYKLQLH